MRILIATSVFPPMINGVSVFAGNLAKGLANRGHEVVVITPSQNLKSHVENRDNVKIFYLKSRGIKIYPDQIHKAEKKHKIFYKNSLKVSLFPGGEIRRILDEFKPDIIHSQGSDPIGVAVSKYGRKHGIPVVATEHNRPEVLTEPIHLPKVLGRGANKILSSYFRKNLKKADKITMPTKLSAEELFKDSKDVVAISNGVDLSAFRPGKPDKTIYNIYGVPSDVPIVLYVGRVDPEKKIGVVLEAFAQFLDKHKLDRLSKTLFLVVGDGVDKSRLVREVKARGLQSNVKFFGRVVGEDLYNMYRMGDVFVTASEIETQGIVLIEAAASGLPLVAVDAGAVREVCRDGVNGYLVKPGDTSSIAEAMDKILSDKKLIGQMSDKSIKIANEHSLEKTLDKFIEIYTNLVENKVKKV